MSITVGGGLGVRISGGIVVGPSVGVSLSGNDYAVYLLRDDFTTAAAAPLASPRTAEPGPGTLTLVQNDGQFSTSGGKLNFPAQTTPAWGDQGFYGAAQTRAAGLVLVFRVSKPSTATFGPQVGFSTAQGAGLAGLGLYFSNAGALVGISGANIDLGGIIYVANTEYTVAVILRSAGILVSIKGGAFADWTLLWIDATNATATLYPSMGNFSAVGTLDTFRVRDLPAPFDTDTGLATAFTASPSANATITSAANAVIEFTWTAVTGETLELSVRRTDDDNRWIIRGDQAGSTVKLIEEVAGVETERASAAQTWTNTTAYRVVVVQDGDVIRGYVANVLKWTYNSASFNNTATGVKTNKAGTNLAAWPRTLTGTAATILDQSVA